MKLGIVIVFLPFSVRNLLVHLLSYKNIALCPVGASGSMHRLEPYSVCVYVFIYMCVCVCRDGSIILISTQKNKQGIFSGVAAPRCERGSWAARQKSSICRSICATAPRPTSPQPESRPSEDSRHTNDPRSAGCLHSSQKRSGLGCFLSAYPWRISRHAELGGDLGGDRGLMRGITHLIWLHIPHIAGKHCTGGDIWNTPA